MHAPPPDGEQDGSDQREGRRDPHRPVVSGGRWCHGRPRIAFDEPRPLERSGVLRRLRARANAAPSSPPPPTASPRVDDITDPRLRQQAGPEHGRERRRDPGAHTVTSSRMFSSVASPIPLTSTNWSTEVNGRSQSGSRRWPGRSPRRRRAAPRARSPRGVDVDQPGHAATAPPTQAAPRSPSRGTRTWMPSASGAARFSDSSSARAARRIDRVDHPRPLFELVHAGTAHPTGDVHEDHDLRRRAGRRREYRGPVRPGISATSIGRGSDRTYHRPAPPSVTAGARPGQPAPRARAPPRARGSSLRT